MTSATSGESGDRVPPRPASLAGEIAFTPASGVGPRRRLARWWALAVAVAVVAVVVGIAVWNGGDGSEPDALVTATDPAPTSTTAPTAVTTTTNATTVTSVAGPAVAVDSGSTSTAARPIVPASTSTTGPSATEPSTTKSSVDGTIVVSPDADPTAPQVSLVDEAITDAVVVDPIPNTALNEADRSATRTVPSQTTPPLVCGGPVVRLDTTALVDSDRLVVETFDGQPGEIVVSNGGIGIAGGRDGVRIDYSADRGGSERIIVDLGTSRCAIAVEFADLAPAEWQGAAESAHWVGLDDENRTVGEGWLLGTGESLFVLDLVAPVDRLLIEAAPYGATAAGWPAGAEREVADNSDFVVVAVSVG